MNDNPFSFKGCIGRLSFAVTTTLLYTPILFCIAMNNAMTRAFYASQLSSKGAITTELPPIPLFIAMLFAVPLIFAFIKRTRHVRGNYYLILLMFIPYLGGILGFILWIYLICKKGEETEAPVFPLPAEGQAQSPSHQIDLKKRPASQQNADRANSRGLLR